MYDDPALNGAGFSFVRITVSKLTLPDVTLVMIETRCHQLARMALEDTLAQVDFGDVLIFTDQSAKIPIPSATYINVEDWPEKLGWAQCYWHTVPPYVRTNHILLIQWDSWIFDPVCWEPSFLDYDYIGAPWWYADGLNVGNSGFNLRSKRLMDYLLKEKEQFPCNTWVEDDLLSRKYRRRIEAETGFVWAGQETALRFAFECVREHAQQRHFGFHAMRNWPFVLHPDRLKERLDVARQTPLIMGTDQFDQLGAHPHYIKQRTDGQWILGAL